MAAWLVALFLSPDLIGGVQAEFNRQRLRPARVSVAVGRLGEPPLFRRSYAVPRAPASNQKLVTAAVALTRLGRDFEFETKIGREANGDLVVIGDGDPNLSGRFFDGNRTLILASLARQLKAKGVGRVDGDLVLDASRFDAVYVHPDWPKDQLHRWYCAPVAALVYNDSCWDVSVRPGPAVGAAAVVGVDPPWVTPALDVVCKTVPRRAEHVIHLTRSEEGGLRVRGGVLLGARAFEASVPVPDPVAFFGRALLGALRKEGIQLVGKVRSGKAKDPKILAVFRSSLARTLPVLLQRSQNLYGECLLKRSGDGTFGGGQAAAEQALKKLKVNAEGLEVQDGSGLARTNRVTARTLYELLQVLGDEEVFTSALAAGGEGTLRRRFRDLDDAVRLKTGTISGVRALSGYVKSSDGTRWVMVILAQGERADRVRAFQNAVVRLLAGAR